MCLYFPMSPMLALGEEPYKTVVLRAQRASEVFPTRNLVKSERFKMVSEKIRTGERHYKNVILRVDRASEVLWTRNLHVSEGFWKNSHWRKTFFPPTLKKGITKLSFWEFRGLLKHFWREIWGNLNVFRRFQKKSTLEKNLLSAHTGERHYKIVILRVQRASEALLTRDVSRSEDFWRNSHRRKALQKCHFEGWRGSEVLLTRNLSRSEDFRRFPKKLAPEKGITKMSLRGLEGFWSTFDSKSE